ncbi:MAG: hypothetical protein JEZ06_06295 [Anaerolineaceae bacterium]|nr:hypothetical protein [Anaerolineaceae bacterium]
MKKYILNRTYITILLFSIIGCNLLSNMQDEFPYELMIGLDDFSEDFIYGNSGFEELEGAKSFYISYRKKKDEVGSLMSHQITIYSDIDSAKNNIPVWENRLFTNDWFNSKESKFLPSNPEDYYTIRCLLEKINEEDFLCCRVLQQHKNLVIRIIVNINNKNHSFSEFDEILKKLDA